MLKKIFAGAAVGAVAGMPLPILGPISGAIVGGIGGYLVAKGSEDGNKGPKL